MRRMLRSSVMRRMLQLTGFLAGFALTASAAQAGMGSKVTSLYDASFVTVLARAGIPTVILGNVAPGVAPEAIRAMLSPPGWIRAATFVAGQPSPKGMRLVILFNPSDPVAAKRDVCGDLSALSFGPPGGRLVVRAAFCVDSDLATRVTAAERSITGIDDPRLTKLLGRVIDMLFPAANRFTGGSPV